MSAQSATESHSYLFSVQESTPVLHWKEGCSKMSSTRHDPDDHKKQNTVKHQKESMLYKVWFSRRRSEHTDRNVELNPTVLFRTTAQLIRDSLYMCYCKTFHIVTFHHAKFQILLKLGSAYNVSYGQIVLPSFIINIPI